MLTLMNSFLLLGLLPMWYFGENRSRNATVRVRTDRQTDGRTHAQTERQTEFIICPMLYATAMGQIKSSKKVVNNYFLLNS